MPPNQNEANVMRRFGARQLGPGCHASQSVGGAVLLCVCLWMKGVSA